MSIRRVISDRGMEYDVWGSGADIITIESKTDEINLTETAAIDLIFAIQETLNELRRNKQTNVPPKMKPEKAKQEDMA